MKPKRWTVLIDWSDGDVEDCDEFTVRAMSRAEAVSSAVKEWIEKTKEWPTCELTAITVT